MSDREITIETVKLRKEFKGSVVVDDLDMQIERGDIFGLIGSNGSGKTTIIKMLATLVRPTSGSAYILGYDILRKPKFVRGLIGYAPELFVAYDDLKVWEYLDFFAGAYKIPKRKRAGTISDIMDLMDLSAERNSYIRNLTRGMKQRLCIARTLVHDPAVLLLDEPASGLDPKARFELSEILKELASMGKTILISSNILPELAYICNKVCIIEKGKQILSGDTSVILSQIGEGIVLEIGVNSEPEKAKEILQQRKEIGDIDIEGSILKVQYLGDREDIHEVLSSLTNEQIKVSFFHETSINLEDIFLKTVIGRSSSADN